jgi:polyadenylation factor subunit 2
MFQVYDIELISFISTITAHKKQVSCCQWNLNGNWLATGSTDGLIKLFDLRNMREMETLRGQNSEVCRLAWHPVHESLLVSGGYSGNLVYWIVHQHQVSFE